MKFALLDKKKSEKGFDMENQQTFSFRHVALHYEKYCSKEKGSTTVWTSCPGSHFCFLSQRHNGSESSTVALALQMYNHLVMMVPVSYHYTYTVFVFARLADHLRANGIDQIGKPSFPLQL